ncbi:hypothetical protein CP533_1850 [Ophiocordyceps camponoti-saundersi (nom. inval.)]|nr:hypothetical protein CP533_1850 [Ophiocordyceps camponoti-saundersi (nom. inval.)]
MASPGSLKHLSKVIIASVTQPALPLPDNTLDAIAVYLEQHEKHDSADSERLQDELSTIFEKHVKGNLTASAPWMAVVWRLLPALPTSDRIWPWFESCKGLLDRTGIVLDEVIAALVQLIEHYQPSSEEDGLVTNPIIDVLLSISITRLYPALSQGNTSHEYNDKIVRRALKSFGKKRPKEFFTSVDAYFVRKQHRHASLRLLCDFIHEKPPHLHEILHTSIFPNLLACLQLDASTTVVSSALTVLIMLLPHMPNSVVPHLPTLFNIYARLLFWDRDRSRATETLADDTVPQFRGWEACTYDAEMDDFDVPQLANYYTILYGLYPINFMDYIRKPQRYLRHANIPNSDDIEVQPTEIRHRSERFRRCHLLHSNFYTMTIDSEKTDNSRWIKSEAAEVLVACTELYCPADLRDLHRRDAPPPMPGSAVDDRPEKDVNEPAPWVTAEGSRGSWRNSQLTSTDSEAEASNPPPQAMMRRRVSHPSQAECRSVADQGQAADSPAMAAQSTHSPSSQSQLQDLIRSNKVIKSGLHQSLANDSVPSLSLSQQEPATQMATTAPRPTANSPPGTTVLGTQLANLQRRVLMLENDLSFERYVKQQHMAHIGELRRRQMVEAASEAETQNLIMLNRNLKSRCEEAKKAERQILKESEKSRALAKKWEADLAGKLKLLRDESKRAGAELDALRRQLEESVGECEKLRKLVCDGEVKELNLQQSMQSVEIQKAEVDRLREQVEELTKSGHDQHSREVERQAALRSAAAAEAKVESMRMELAASKHDGERERDLLRDQVTELKVQLAEAQEERARPGSNSNLAMESAFAASRAKQAELQKQYNLLLRKYTALQSSLLDMQSEAAAAAAAAAAASAITATATATRGPRGQEATDPSESEGQPLSPVRSEATTTYNNSRAPRPVSYAGVPTSASAAEGSVSSERHFGGRLHSRSRKEARDKGGKEEGSGKTKKEKKPSGLRGIRGFV